MPRGGFGSRGRGGGFSGTFPMIGDNLHSSVCLVPPPLYPPLDTKPLLPLTESAEIQYAAEIKQELLNRFHESPYFIEETSTSEQRDIVRYTDKYRQVEKESWTPNWDRLPKELRWDMPRKRLQKTGAAPPTKKRRMDLSNLEDIPEVRNEGDSEKKKNEEEDEEEEGGKKEAPEEESVSDEDVEEENDYIQSYFDNGEGYLDESDDNLDEDATY